MTPAKISESQQVLKGLKVKIAEKFPIFANGLECFESKTIMQAVATLMSEVLQENWSQMNSSLASNQNSSLYSNLNNALQRLIHDQEGDEDITGFLALSSRVFRIFWLKIPALQVSFKILIFRHSFMKL